MISVVILCHNYARFLPACVASVRAQTCSPSEIIVVNDGSTDDTAAAARRLDVRLIEQERGGEGAAANAGIRASKGEFYVRLDADDLLHPLYLERTLETLHANPEASFAYTRGVMFGAQRRLLWSQDYSLGGLWRGNFISSTALVRRAVFDASPGFDITLRWSPDWDFWLTLAERGFRAVLVPEFLFFYRQHHSSLRARVPDALKRAQLAAIRRKHRRFFPPWLRLQATLEAGLYRAVGTLPARLYSASPCTYQRLRRLVPIGIPPPPDYDPKLSFQDIVRRAGPLIEREVYLEDQRAASGQ